MASRLNMQGAKLGGYTIIDRLGAGGMGSVYRARDEALNRFVAIKVLAPAMESDPVCIKRFQREARSIAALRHPNLMHVYAVGEERGLHYFVMEYIEGRPLSKLLAERDKLSLDETMRIAGMLMGALNKVHGADIVHRDLKPGNVMIDADGRAVLVDFGLSKDTTAAAELTGAGAIMGTPDYMAPEQVEGEEVAPRTDIYALGVMLYEMLSGVKPFHRKSAVLTMRAHCEERPQPLSDLRPDLPKVLDAVLDKAMARHPAKRYQSVPVLAGDLARVCREPAILELAREFSAPSSAPTIVNDPSRAPTSAPRSRRGVTVPTGKPAARPPEAEVTIPATPPPSPARAAPTTIPARARAARRQHGHKSSRRGKVVVQPPARLRLRDLQWTLLGAGAALLVAGGVYLGRRWRRGRPQPHGRPVRERYGGSTVRGVSAPRVQVLTRGGRRVSGTLLPGGRDGLRIRKDGGNEIVLIPAGDLRIMRVLPANR